MASRMTQRSRAKAERYSAILSAATRLFAERGFNSVSISELGAAVGVSGPAVYRHFPDKQAILAAILLEVSERLFSGGQRVVSRLDVPREQLQELIHFHVGFALAEADVIRLQDRELRSLGDDESGAVRQLQREYVNTWVDVLARLHPGRERPVLQAQAHACFGLMNSTHYSASHRQDVTRELSRSVLEGMAVAALTS